MYDTLFQIAGLLAMAGWVALLFGWIAPVPAQRIAGFAVPLLLSVPYAGLVMAFWSRAPGDFDTLEAVMALFTMPQIALAGWLHYLAFDLMIGAWEVRVARREGIPALLVVPCLALTFLFGPAGLLAFTALRAGRGAARTAGVRP